jgi:Holliday junction DNA helicase RuvB
MAREALFQGSPDPQRDQDRELRPQRMDQMVGQREVYERLRIAVQAAIARQEPLGHVLLEGPPGLGKTTFALCLPREMGVNVQITTGAALKAPKDLIPYLTNADERSVLFVDEIHRLPKAVEEYLYPAMEDFRLDLVLGEGTSARTLNLWIKPFTLIGATTRAGLLSAPLRDRFQIREHLDFYNLEDLTEIVRRNARKLQIQLDDQAAVEIARRSRDTPRIANNHLRWVRDYATTKAQTDQVTAELTRAALEMAEVDDRGLDRLDRKYLLTLMRVFGGGPAGIEAVGHTMNADPDTLADEVEPFLLRTELVVRTPRGRVATSRAYAHLRIDPPADAQVPSSAQARLFE